MAVFLNDTFTGSSAADLNSRTGEIGATWTRHPSFSGTSIVISNANRARTGVVGTPANGLYYASGVPSDAQYDVEAVLTVFDNVGSIGVGPAGRIDTGADSSYRIQWNGTSFKLVKRVAGVQTTLGEWTNTPGAGDYAVKLEIRDAAKKAFIAGVERISSADNAITAAGRAGVWVAGNLNGSDTAGHHLDSITGTDLSVPPDQAIEVTDEAENVLEHNVSTLDFGTVEQGAAEPTRTITLTNTGSVDDLVVESILVAGTRFGVTNAGDMNSDGGTIGPGLSATVVLQMFTDEVGEHGPESLQIISDATNTPSFLIFLTGEVTEPAVTAKPWLYGPHHRIIGAS